MKTTETLIRIAVTLVGIIFVLLPFHAPLSVFFSSLFPIYSELIKAWKEILIFIIFLLLIIPIYQKKVYRYLWRDKLLLVMGVFIALHILLFIVIPQDISARMAGIVIDLRYIAFFCAVATLSLLIKDLRKRLLLPIFISTALSILFAFLQVALLPKDILSYIGYSKETIAPYLTVDQNQNFIRINGTLRGPNPLGIFAGSFMILLATYLTFCWKKVTHKISLLVLLLVASIVLWNTYSRSAYLATILGLLLVLLYTFRRHTKYIAAGGVIAGLIIVVLFGVFQESSFVQQIIFHNNPQTGSVVDSDEQRAISITTTLQAVMTNPIGHGIGSTGSASLYSQQPLIVENFYLFVAHESGLMGLLLFVAILGLTLYRLYEKRRDWFSFGLFAAGCGIAFASLALPVLTDDTVALLWWGLAALALYDGRGSHDKKTKRIT